MTVQVINNFYSVESIDRIISLYSGRLEEVESRPNFYEDLTDKRYKRPTPLEKKTQSDFPEEMTEREKEGLSMINDISYRVKKEIELFYDCGSLNSFEGGMVYLTEGAENGLHSDIYNLDGSIWEDGTGRGEDFKYSALLYMSDYEKDFTGGSIIFPNQGIEVFPKKGTLVYFIGDLDHVHEVKRVNSGTRYAIVMFFGN